MRSNRAEGVVREVYAPRRVVQLDCLRVHLACGQIAHGDGELEWRGALERDEPVCARGVVSGKDIVQTVRHAVVVLEAYGRAHEHLLLEEEAFRARDDCILVLRERVGGVADLLHLVVDTSGLRRAELEASARLDAAERRLVEELRRAEAVVLRDVVHDLERRPAYHACGCQVGTESGPSAYLSSRGRHGRSGSRI